MTFCPPLLLSRGEETVEDHPEKVNQGSDDEHQRPFFASLEKQRDTDEEQLPFFSRCSYSVFGEKSHRHRTDDSCQSPEPIGQTHQNTRIPGSDVQMIDVESYATGHSLSLSWKSFLFSLPEMAKPLNPTAMVRAPIANPGVLA